MKRTALRRRTPIARKAMRRRVRSTSYSRRQRDIAFMIFVRGLPCSVEEHWPAFPMAPTPCAGPVEADHLGDRGLSHKAADDTCAPMCHRHHVERTDHTGTFKRLTKEQCRTWKRAQVLRVQTLWKESRGMVVA